MGFSHGKATVTKIRDGNPGKRPLNIREPKFRTMLPEPPPYLHSHPLAMENWCKEGELLVKRGVMTEADWGILASRSYLFSEMVGMINDIHSQGRMLDITSISRDGTITMKSVPNPLIKMRDAVISEYRRQGSLLGLTPVDRSRVQVGGDKKEEDKLKEFLAG